MRSQKGHMSSAEVIRDRLRSHEIGYGHMRTAEVTAGLLRSHEDGKGLRGGLMRSHAG